MKTRILSVAIILFAMVSGLFAQADMKETMAMIKKNLADSKEKLKKCEWIETTTTFVNGEKKSVKQNQCYYSLDGKLTKVETGGSVQGKTPGGLRGKIAAGKKEDMADYIKAAIAKVHAYLPPDAGKIQQTFEAGKMAIQILEPGKKFKLSFPDFNEKGDLLSISVDKANQKILAMSVTTTVDDPAKKVVFDVVYSILPDGTQYASSTTLDAQAKNLKLVIENSGFKMSAGK